jgi:hypothetical protein
MNIATATLVIWLLQMFIPIIIAIIYKASMISYPNKMT